MEQAGTPKILVVDDEPDAVEFVRTILEEAGYDVIDAPNGQEGLQKAVDEKPDLVILDVQMPVKDGFAVFDEMQKTPGLESIPVVMLTGVRERVGIGFSADDMKEYFGHEPEAYIEKPIDPEKLQATVKKILSG